MSKFNYKFDALYGISYKCGNILFSNDGNRLYSPIGNKIQLYDLVNNVSKTLPIECKKNIRRMVLSPDDKLLVVIDEDGYGILVNNIKMTVLHRFSMNMNTVRAMAISKDGNYLAITMNQFVQIWRTPSSLHKEFSPLILHRKYAGHFDDVTCISFSPDSRYFCTGSKDTTIKIFSVNKESDDFEVVTLSGHTTRIVSIDFQYEKNFNEEQQALPVIYTVSKDGTLFIWKYKWNPNYKHNQQLKEQKIIEEESSSDSDSDSESELETIVTKKKSTKKNKIDDSLSTINGSWHLYDRHFLQKNNAKIYSCYIQDNLLLAGFSNGTFTLFELNVNESESHLNEIFVDDDDDELLEKKKPPNNYMNSLTELQTLSVSQHSIGTCIINPTGDWIALASNELGQLLIWEWKSETYILKQQGHFYDLNCLAYSKNGLYIATGGDDNKLKLWNSISGFCFVTFNDHEGPITDCQFISDGNAIISASMDGTVRAFDLIRYRNFRTMVTPEPTQLTSLAIDGNGEIICAGGFDPPSIFVWSLQTGKLLDILTGHEGPISSLAFSLTRPIIASTSWDKTIKVWEPYKSTTSVDTFQVLRESLAVAFRPDGREIACTTSDGKIYFFNVDDGIENGYIECKKDLSENKSNLSIRGKCFNSIDYTADGKCVVACGRSKYVCLYQVEQKLLIKKFQISHNQSYLGANDGKINTKKIIPGINNDTGNQLVEDLDLSGDDEDSENELINRAVNKDNKANTNYGGSDLSKRNVKQEIRAKKIKFSPTGNAFATATTEGMIIFTLDSAQIFDPINIDENITPKSIRALCNTSEYGKALLYALHLSEEYLIKEILFAIPMEYVKLIATNVPQVHIQALLNAISTSLEESKNIELLLTWSKTIMSLHNNYLSSNTVKMLQSFRGLQKILTKHQNNLSKLTESNLYTLEYLCDSNNEPLIYKNSNIDNIENNNKRLIDEEKEQNQLNSKKKKLY